MFSKKFGQYLERIRLANNLSQRDLDNRTGISYSHISAIENGDVTLTRDKVVALSRGFPDVSPSEMLEKAGFIPEDMIMENKEAALKLADFKQRLAELLEQKQWSLDILAAKSGIDVKALRLWARQSEYQSSTPQPPDLISLHKLAAVLGVTPDYLAGYAEAPDSFSNHMPRPKNLRDILDNEELVFDKIPIGREEKERLHKIIPAVFERPGK